MKSTRVILTSLLAALFMLPVSALAEDIDIYSGLGTTGNVPNVLIIMDTAASFSANASGTCTYADGSGSPSAGNTPAGIEQCALYNTIKGLPVKADGSALINLGFMVYNSVGVAAAYPSAGCISNNNGGCLLIPLTAMTEANKTTVLNWIKGWVLNDIKTNNQGNAMTMQEAWAYYAGGQGASTRDYSSIKPAAGCQKNFVVYIGNAYDVNTTPGDNGSPSSKLSSAGNTDTSTIAIPSGTYGLPMAYNSCGSYTMPSHSDSSGLYADEWARFMAKNDLYTASGEPQSAQSIVTYTIGALGPTCKADYPALLKSMADAGNGKYFPTDANNADSIAQALLRILNEVQAVNSVFASSTLPVSVNAQGTFLNQIYIGMFRPDPGALPRWSGNLKQYKVIIDAITGKPQLGDSTGEPAISSAGTGFIAPDAISFWTCTRSDNPYLTNISASRNSKLTSQGQICANDPVGGFWKNFAIMNNSAGKGFDLADGDWVEKGGVNQQIRLANLTNDYAANPRAPRKLYTHCPSDSDCQAALTHDNNAFATDNTGITASMFGGASSVNVSSITRSGVTATVTTTGAHGFANNATITISGATPADYNGDKTISVLSATIFTYTVTEYPPASATVGTSPTYRYQVVPHAASAITVNSITRSSSATSTANTATATVTTAVNHGYASNDSIVISGASPDSYNGIKNVTVTSSTQFQYSVTVNPPATAVNTYTVELHSRTPIPISSGSRSGSTGTITTSIDHGLHTGSYVTISGTGTGSPLDTSNTNFNKSVNITVTSNTTFTYGVSGNPSGVSGGTATPAATLQAVSSLTRTGTGDTATATATIPTGYRFATGDIVDIKKTGGSATNETAYEGTYTITCSTAACTTFTYTITTSPSTSASGSMSAALSTTPINITSLTRSGATATATLASAIIATQVDIFTNPALTPIPGESAYTGTFTVPCDVAPCTTFTYPVTLTPASPASGTMVAHNPNAPPDRNTLINWVRGEDNYGDETGPGGGVTIRPSVHGDVLHSRPLAINYGGAEISITGTTDSGSIRTATASATDVAKIGTIGKKMTIAFSTGQRCTATVATATTFTYAAKNCGNSGEQTAVTGASNVVVYYGDNGGAFHAVNGNQVNPPGSTLPAPGTELWGFIPKDFFPSFPRLRSNNPQLLMESTPPGIVPSPRKKDYFVDGSTGLYQLLDNQGRTLQAYVYLSMRRGGNFIYALDVTTPTSPRFLWKVSNATSGMEELGQTWSMPKVAKVKGHSNPVLIFAAGYDPKQDADPPVYSDSMGRGIFVLDAFDGTIVWRGLYGAGYSGLDSANVTYTSSGSPATAFSERMRYSIPSDIALVDRDLDGYIDRLYVGDLGGQIWRVDTEPSGNATPPSWSPSTWKLHRLASLGECSSGVCRKFFFPPEVIRTENFDAVIAGSGDREHPLYNNTAANGKQNMVFLLKDIYTGKDATGMTRIRHTSDETDLCNATTVTSAQCTTCLETQRGYYINMQDGEKVINAPLVAAGSVYFSTHKPVSPSSTSCVANLGEARGYKLEPFKCSYSSQLFAGGGFTPSPIAGAVIVEREDGTSVTLPFMGGTTSGNGDNTDSGLDISEPTIDVPTSRTRTYWYKEGK